MRRTRDENRVGISNFRLVDEPLGISSFVLAEP